MNKMSKFYFTFGLIFFVSFNLLAQGKFEKESRIKTKEVPPLALKFIDSLGLSNKIKWHREEGLNRKSIEAKFHYQKVQYSVEFDTLGKVEDLEMDTEWSELNLALKDSIAFQLQKDCLKHKIIKVQKQYSGNESEILSKIKNNKSSQYLTTNYELIVKCTLQNDIELFEYLFSESGKSLSITKIILKNSTHLEY